MSRFKDMSFMLFILLTGISAMYEVVAIEDTPFPIIKESTGIGAIEELRANTLETLVSNFFLEIGLKESVETTAQTNPLNFFSAAIGGFNTLWGIVATFVGWTILVSAIFGSLDLSVLSILFIPPLVIIQFLGAFYFLRDIVNTIRGVAST